MLFIVVKVLHMLHILSMIKAGCVISCTIKFQYYNNCFKIRPSIPDTHHKQYFLPGIRHGQMLTPLR